MKLDQIIMYLPPLSTTQKRSIYFYTLPWLRSGASLRTRSLR